MSTNLGVNPAVSETGKDNIINCNLQPCKLIETSILTRKVSKYFVLQILAKLHIKTCSCLDSFGIIKYGVKYLHVNQHLIVVV